MDNQAPKDATEPIERVLEQLNVGSAFGTAITQGDVTLIPVADASINFGYGWGSGNAPAQLGETAQERAGSSGAGGGGRAQVSPQGYIRITPDGVAYEPVLNIMRLSLSGMFLAGWNVYWITRTIRRVAKLQARS